MKKTRLRPVTKARSAFASTGDRSLCASASRTVSTVGTVAAVGASAIAGAAGTSAIAAADRGELLGVGFLRQRLGDLVEVAVHDVGDPVEREVDPMIGDAALREVVRADALAAIAAADQALALGGLLGMALAAFLVAQPRREHRHRALAVAMLRAIVLAFDDDTGGEMREPNRRVGLVDVLAARARRAERVDAQV